MTHAKKSEQWLEYFLSGHSEPLAKNLYFYFAWARKSQREPVQNYRL